MKITFKSALFYLSITFCVLQSAYGQLEEKMMRENVERGSIILKGKEVEGYIKKKGTGYIDSERLSAPWQFQDDIRFISKEVFENKEKIKNRDFNKYSPKDIDGYKYNGDSLTFVSNKYSDMSAVGTGMIPKWKFMREVLDGEISIYHHYQSPPSVGSTTGLRAMYVEYAENPEIVYQKGEDEKMKLVNGMNVEKELADCEEVVKKFQNQEYEVLENSNEEKSKLKSLANKTVFRVESRITAIKAYNETCGQ
jgi:hypothetical protein